MRERAIAPWILLLALAGCAKEAEQIAIGERPPNVPGVMPDARPSQPIGTPEERAKKVADLLKQAEAATAKKDHAAAVEAVRQAIMIEPKDRKVLLELARTFYALARAQFQPDPAESYRSIVSAANYLRTLHDYYPDQTEEEKALAPEIYFYSATQNALSVRVEETSGDLNDAIGAGFKDFDRIRNSPDWKTMLEQPHFQKAFPDLVKKK